MDEEYVTARVIMVVVCLELSIKHHVARSGRRKLYWQLFA